MSQRKITKPLPLFLGSTGMVARLETGKFVSLSEFDLSEESPSGETELLALPRVDPVDPAVFDDLGPEPTVDPEPEEPNHETYVPVDNSVPGEEVSDEIADRQTLEDGEDG